MPISGAWLFDREARIYSISAKSHFFTGLKMRPVSTKKCDFPSGSAQNGRFWQQIPLLGTSQTAEILLPNSSRFVLERAYRINPRFPKTYAEPSQLSGQQRWGDFA